MCTPYPLYGSSIKSRLTDDTHRETWPDCERRLNVEVPSDHLLSGLIERIGGPMPERLKNGRAGSSVGARSKL